MNGISSTLKDELKKNNDGKQKDKFKFILTILLTNVLVAILCLSGGEKNEIITSNKKILHPDYEMMELPLTSLVTETNHMAAETPVTLLSRDRKIISEKAFLHEETRKENDVSFFKIEIKRSEVHKIGELIQEGMIVLPYVEIKKTKIANKNRRESKYEVAL